LLDVVFLVGTVFSFRGLEISFRFFLASKVSTEKPSAHLNGDYRTGEQMLFSCCLRILSLSCTLHRMSVLSPERIFFLVESIRGHLGFLDLSVHIFP
jgi:hypothetical protein